MRRLLVVFLVSACIAFGAAISTIGAINGNVGMFGYEGATPTYGQTFTATASENVLDSMLFRIASSNAIDFRAYVYQWDSANSAIVGPALFTSDVRTIPNTEFGFFEDVSVATGGIELTPGTVYIAMYSTLGLTGSGYAAWENAPDSAYAGGKFEYNNASDFGGLGSNWNNYGDFGDLGFTLELSNAVPEPGAWLLSIGGALFLALLNRKRRSGR